MKAALLLALALCGCAAGSAYTPESAYRKLAGQYPGMRIASRVVPDDVSVQRGIVYARHLQFDLYRPTGAKGPVPVVVLVHGGGWRSGDRSNLAAMAIGLARRGYAAVALSYRLSGEARYPAAVDDVTDAVRWLREHGQQHGIDEGRIGIAGASAGGQIASLVGVTGSGVQAIVNIDGLSDFTSAQARLYEDDPAKHPSAAAAWFGGRYAEKPELWREASPTFYVNTSTPPMLFIGSAQPRFSVGRDEMAAKLRGHGVDTQTVLLPDTPHSFWLFDPWLAPTLGAMDAFLARHLKGQPWTADLGNGSYRNPVLHADYADPDAIRVGDTYYMTSSSFSNVPGLPLLQSKDLVNWSLVGHALPRLEPAAAFTQAQPGKGVWAPCLRYHDGKFWIFYPDPDRGIYVVTAERFSGPWSAPHLLLAGPGIIDPAPLWDDDGKAWLLHAWAKSRAGFNNVLTLRPMAPDARSILGPGKVVIDGNRLPGYVTLEGPKFYKRDGYYYVFAPAGGVEHGWQSVFRSRRADGPYEDRIVMDQGSTSINGPHQGAWVTAADGGDWFIHFQDKRAYGRVVHLQPMRWDEGWPLIGAPSPKTGVGQPVAEYRKPVQLSAPVTAPPAGDEFSQPQLGLQWQWAANWDERWYSLSIRPGFLRLYGQPLVPDGLRATPSVLSQKLPAPAFTVDVALSLSAGSDGDSAGLVLNGLSYAWLGLRRHAGMTNLVLVRCDAAGACAETTAPANGEPVRLRMEMAEGAVARFSYSLGQGPFKEAGPPFAASMGRWVGAQVGLFAATEPGGFADIDYFRVTR